MRAPRFFISKPRRLALCALAAIVAHGSATAQSAPLLDRYKVPVLKLTGRAIGDPDNFYRPNAVEYINGKLVVIDRGADLMVHMLDAETGRTIHRFGRQGSGPGEFQAPWSIVKGLNPKEFWIFDASLRRMTRIDPDRDFPDGRYTPGHSFQLAGGTELNSMLWLTDGTLPATGFVRDGMFAVYDSTGRQRSSRGRMLLGDTKLPDFVRHQAYPTKISAAGPNRIVLATGYSDRVEFYDNSGRRTGNAERPFGFEPVFVVSNKGGDPYIASPPDMRDGYTGIAHTDSQVYALFSGRRYGDYKTQSGFARHVHVFSWAGRLLAVLALDADVLDIAIDPAGRHLYAIRDDPLPGIVVYPIPEEVSRMR